MPELRCGSMRLEVAAGSSLLDALNSNGVAVPYSCRAGSCHACLLKIQTGEPDDAKPDALSADARAAGWRLACQCRVAGDLCVEVFDPRRDGVAAVVRDATWLSPAVLRLRLQPERPVRYQAGQHVVLWTANGVARPYSIASLPQQDAELEFHLDCARPGAFADQARLLKEGDSLSLGERRGGALHYDPDWQARPLWLFAAGTGLAPLWGLVREALRQGHQGAIRLVHIARPPQEHYLRQACEELAAQHPNLTLECIEQLPAGLRLASRQTVALVCGSPASVEAMGRALFMAGLPRGQLFADAFLERA